MFGTQTMASQLLPATQQAALCPLHTLPVQFCYFQYHTWPCHYIYVSIPCHWNYYSCHFGHFSITPTIAAQAQLCPVGTNPCLISQDPCLVSQDPRGPGGLGGDPVLALQTLRQQLEVTLAGVRAQEAELQRQRAATGTGGEGGHQGRGGRGAGAQRSK
jgi:hypothetical protein